MQLSEFVFHVFGTVALLKVNYISHTVILVLKFVPFSIKNIPSVFVWKMRSSNNSLSFLPPSLSFTTAVDAE